MAGIATGKPQAVTAHVYLRGAGRLRQAGKKCICWPVSILRDGPYPPGVLIDAMVDIAWSMLLPRALEPPPLEIYEQNDYLFFKLVVSADPNEVLALSEQMGSEDDTRTA